MRIKIKLKLRMLFYIIFLKLLFNIVLHQKFTFMAVLPADLQRTSFGRTDEEVLLHVRTTRLSHLRGANQVQRIHEAVPLLTLDRGNSLPLDLELVNSAS